LNPVNQRPRNKSHLKDAIHKEINTSCSMLWKLALHRKLNRRVKQDKKNWGCQCMQPAMNLFEKENVMIPIKKISKNRL